MKTKMCPNCKKTRMTNVGHRRYYDCVACGEIIVLEDQQPIFNIPNEMLPLEFTSNLPVNYYLPYRGITTKHHIADWKAICIIYDKKNPEKRWLRFYWWQRYLQDYISSSVSLGRDEGLKWQAKKGVMSPNVYRKELLPKFIETLKTLKAEWMEEKGMEYTEVEEYDE